MSKAHGHNPRTSIRGVPFGTVLALAVATLVGGACNRSRAAQENEVVNKGAGLYAKLCATCHGPTGNGYIADNAPSLKTTTFLSTVTDDFLRVAILRGRPGTAMGAYGRDTGGPLQVDDANAIVAFLREGGPEPVKPPEPGPGDVTAGQKVYEANCMRCHGTKTQRVSAVHLANPMLLSTATDAFLRYAVENGRPPTSMVPWKGALTPKQIDDVVAYVRTMAGPVPPPPPPPPPRPPAAPRTGPIVLNPKGGAPVFELRDDRFVGIDQVKKAMDQKRRMIIADARSPGEWSMLHIKGAISTPYYDKASLDDIPNDGTWVLAYCACPHHVSGEVVDELRKRGYKHTAVIDEGVYAWQQKGYPVVTAPGAQPPPAPPPMPSHEGPPAFRFKGPINTGPPSAPPAPSAPSAPAATAPAPAAGAAH